MSQAQTAAKAKLKRGRKPDGSRAVAIERKPEIIRRLANGEPIAAVAKSVGYDSYDGIVARLGSDPEYQAALKSGAFGKLETRERELEAADTNVAVTRADRLLGHARWWAERVNRDQFGQKPDIQVTIGASLIQLIASLDTPKQPDPISIEASDSHLEG